MPLKIVYCNQVTFVHIIIDVINQATFQRAIYKIIRRFPMYSPICIRDFQTKERGGIYMGTSTSQTSYTD